MPTTIISFEKCVILAGTSGTAASAIPVSVFVGTLVGVVVSLVLVVAVIMTVMFCYMKRWKAKLSRGETEQENHYDYVMESAIERIGETNTVTAALDTKVNEA